MAKDVIRVYVTEVTDDVSIVVSGEVDHTHNSFAGPIRFGDFENSDYSEFEIDGTLIFHGEATVYRDLVLSGLGFTPGGAEAPDLINFIDSNLQAYAFNGMNTTERLYNMVEVNHDYEEGSNIELHIHWAPATSGSGDVKWQVYYSWANSGETFPTPTLVSAVSSADGAWENTYTHVASIDGTGKTINSQIAIQVFRDPSDAEDTYSDDVALVTFGIHYRCDTTGSRSIVTKS
jgi:hypothetical protein